eukprot:60618-Amphidinium_carterae.3
MEKQTAARCPTRIAHAQVVSAACYNPCSCSCAHATPFKIGNVGGGGGGNGGFGGSGCKTPGAYSVHLDVSLSTSGGGFQYIAPPTKPRVPVRSRCPADLSPGTSFLPSMLYRRMC